MGVPQAFDGTLSTKWLDFGGGEGGEAWLEYRLPSSATPLTMSHYDLKSAEDPPERDPASWVLQGSLEEATHVGENEITWYTLDERKDVVFDQRHQTLSFAVSDLRPCRCALPCVRVHVYVCVSVSVCGCGCACAWRGGGRNSMCASSF